MGNDHRFGIWLQTVRKNRKLTQADLAAKLDRSVDAISNIERGKSLPSFEMLEALSRALAINPGEMFEFSGPQESSSRAALLTKLFLAARDLSEPDLHIAVEQIAALAKRQRK